MNWDSRIEHWQEARQLYEQAMLTPTNTPDWWQLIALANLHATCATISETFGGTLDSLAHQRKRQPKPW